MALWNLSRLAETLLPLLDANEKKSLAIAEKTLAGFSECFSQQYMSRFRAKFGLAQNQTEHDELIQDGLSLIANQQVDFTLFFRQLTRAASGDSSVALSSLFTDQDTFLPWFARWRNAVDPTEQAATILTDNEKSQPHPDSTQPPGRTSNSKRLRGRLFPVSPTHQGSAKPLLGAS